MIKSGLMAKLFGERHDILNELSLNQLRTLAEQTADSLNDLSFPSASLPQNISRGIHPRRQAGSGDNFWQYRPYSTGDDAKNIDWRRSARSDQHFVKEHEWQTSQHAWIWCDGSPSMHWRSEDHILSKYDHARLLTIASARLLEKSGERLGMLGLHDRTREGIYAYERLIEGLQKTDHQQHLPDARIPQRGAQIFIFSDFLMADLNTLKQWMVNMNRQGVRGHLIHIIDPAEATLPGRGRTRFQGLEGEGTHTIARVEDQTADYEYAIQTYWNNLKTYAKSCHWSLTRSYSHQPATETLSHLLQLSDAAQASKRGAMV